MEEKNNEVKNNEESPIFFKMPVDMKIDLCKKLAGKMKMKDFFIMKTKEYLAEEE